MILSTLPYQEELEMIASGMTDLRATVHSDSELAIALDCALHQLEPFWNNVEFSTPISLDDLNNFRSHLSGMKL